MSNSIEFFTKVTVDYLESIGLKTRYLKEHSGDGYQVYAITDDEGNSMGAVTYEEGVINYVMQKGDTYHKIICKILSKREEAIISDYYPLEISLECQDENYSEEEHKLKGELFNLLVLETYDMVGFRKMTEEQKTRENEIVNILSNIRHDEKHRENDTNEYNNTIEDLDDLLELM